MKINIKMLAAAVLTASLLCDCSGEEAAEEPAVSAISVSGPETITTAAGTTSEETTSAETTAAELAGTVPETEETSVSAESTAVTAPDEIFNENLNMYVVALCKDGTYKKLTNEEYYDITASTYVNEVMSEEYFNEYVKDDEYIGIDSYEEFKKQLLESLDLTEDDLTKRDEYTRIYSIANYDGDGRNTDKAARAAFDHVISRTETDENKNEVYITCYGIDDDIIMVDAYSFLSYGYRDSEEYCIAENEYISVSGRELVILGGIPVPADTKSLYISAYDETRASMIDDDTGYERVIYDYGENYGDERAVLDTAELAEKLPELERLYISAYIEVSDFSAFTEMNKLKELKINVSGCEDISALSGLKTDKLSISGLSCPANVLKDLKVKEISIDCEPANGVLQSIFELDNVTELTISRLGDSEPLLSGIEKMSGLKKLDLSVGSAYTVDLAPVSSLKNVEDLKIMAYHTKNLEKIAKMKSVKKLMLHSMDEEDLSFLSDMTGLEELSLMYVNNSFGPSLQYLENVKYLSIADTTNGADMSRIY